jgi:hypothetical protein
MLHSWIENSMQTVVTATPSSADSLPTSATAFFLHYATSKSSNSASLQRTLSSQATSHIFEASLNAAKAARREGNGWEHAHLKLITAPQAWVWKMTMPTDKALRMNDANYRFSARLNLGLSPDPTWETDRTNVCSACSKHTDDPWHSLVCSVGNATRLRHDTVFYSQGLRKATPISHSLGCT